MERHQVTTTNTTKDSSRTSVQVPASVPHRVTPDRSWGAVQPDPYAIHTELRTGVFEDLDTAVAAAQSAFEVYERSPLKTRFAVVAAIRARSLEVIKKLAHDAVEETEMGRYDHKLQKNRLVIEKTPGPEILVARADSGDYGLTLNERAPYGVIGAITPTTNPTETIICNSIGMLAGGNAVVFNVHPKARNISNFLVAQLNEAIVAAGGPPNLVCSLGKPTIESARQLMSHPGIELLVVTGGPAVVKAAMTSGKRTIAAGPGNPPVVVDETADLDRAARGIVDGGSLDNCIVCVAEKEIICVDQVADQLKALLVSKGAYEVTGKHIDRLQGLVVGSDGLHPNKEWVGKGAAKILAAIGIDAPQAEIIFVESDEDSPFVQVELLMPVLGFVRTQDVQSAIAMAKRVEHGFGHTAAMYSTNIHNMQAMARTINTSILTKNAPTYAGLGLGGEGYTSFTIASPTGEGLTNATHFTRERRYCLVNSFRIV